MALHDPKLIAASIIRIAKQIAFERHGHEDYAHLYQQEANIIWQENQTATNAFLKRYFQRKRPK